MENQIRRIIDQNKVFGLQKIAEATKDYVMRVHKDGYFDVNVFNTAKNTTGYAVGGSYSLVEQDNITAVVFYSKRKERDHPPAVPESTQIDAKNWISRMITSKEVCLPGYERKFIVFKKTVNVCHDEFTPNLSLRRAFDHQKHNQGMYCVLGIVSVGQNNKLYGYTGPHVYSQSFNKGRKQIRVILNSDSCDFYQKNTKTDSDGRDYVDDDWVRTEETEFQDEPVKTEVVTVKEYVTPTNDTIPAPPPPPPAYQIQPAGNSTSTAEPAAAAQKK